MKGCAGVAVHAAHRPGFINLTIRPECLAAEVSARLGDPRLGVPEVHNDSAVVVDFSSPNIAKEMHVGHLRSTIIGASLFLWRTLINPPQTNTCIDVA